MQKIVFQQLKMGLNVELSAIRTSTPNTIMLNISFENQFLAIDNCGWKIKMTYNNARYTRILILHIHIDFKEYLSFVN